MTFNNQHTFTGNNMNTASYTATISTTTTLSTTVSKYGFILANRFKLINRILFMCLTLLTASSISGCSMMNFFVSPSTTLNFVAAKNLNPDIETRPSPVVVKVFELASRGAVETADFFSLYSDYEAILGPELLNKEELVFNPGQKLTYERELNKNTRFIAVLVAYQDIENSRWRDVIAVNPKSYDEFSVYLEKLSVFIRD